MIVLFIIMVVVMVSSGFDKSLNDIENLLYVGDKTEEPKQQEQVVSDRDLESVLDDEEVDSDLDSYKRDASELLERINE